MVCAARHHHGRDGVRGDPREPGCGGVAGAGGLGPGAQRPAHAHPGSAGAAGQPGVFTRFPQRIPKRITPEFVRDEVAAGRAIIPANINHPELEPMIIGRNFLVKINANIGNSALARASRKKWRRCAGRRSGARTRSWIFRRARTSTRRGNGFCGIRRCPSARCRSIRRWKRWAGKAEDLTWRLFRDTLIEQAEQGVDYFTIHAGVLLAVRSADGEARDGHCVARGCILAKWCLAHHQENFLYTHFGRHLRDHGGV